MAMQMAEREGILADARPLGPTLPGLGNVTLRCLLRLVEPAFGLLWIELLEPETREHRMVAEREGFEPSVEQAPHLISSQALSATQAPLQRG